MPVATVSSKSVRLKLSTCEGAWVELCKMGYGDKQIMDGMVVINLQRPPDGQEEVSKIEYDADYARQSAFAFSKCVKDHNLENEQGQKLNLNNGADIAKLDPSIGEEIKALIDKYLAGTDLSAETFRDTPAEVANGQVTETSTGVS